MAAVTREIKKNQTITNFFQKGSGFYVAEGTSVILTVIRGCNFCCVILSTAVLIQYPIIPGFCYLAVFLQWTGWCPMCSMICNKAKTLWQWFHLSPSVDRVTAAHSERTPHSATQQSAHFTTSSACTMRPSPQKTQQPTLCSLHAYSWNSPPHGAPHLAA